MGDLRERLKRQYSTRQPYPSEMQFFSQRPEVAGYAAEDNRVVFNPLTAPIAQDSIHANEALRLHQRANPTPFDFYVRPEQAQSMGPQYQANPQAMRESLMARMFALDPSAGTPTIGQLRALRKQLADAEWQVP